MIDVIAWVAIVGSVAILLLLEIWQRATRVGILKLVGDIERTRATMSGDFERLFTVMGASAPVTDGLTKSEAGQKFAGAKHITSYIGNRGMIRFAVDDTDSIDVLYKMPPSYGGSRQVFLDRRRRSQAVQEIFPACLERTPRRTAKENDVPFGAMRVLQAVR